MWRSAFRSVNRKLVIILVALVPEATQDLVPASGKFPGGRPVPTTFDNSSVDLSLTVGLCRSVETEINCES